MRTILALLLFSCSCFGQVEMQLLSLLNPAAGGAGTPASSLVTNLVAYWRMDETSGNRADSVGANTLTDNNTVGYVSGLVTNSSMLVSNNLEYLSCADNADLSTVNKAWTLAVWAKLYTTNVGRVGIASKYKSTGNEREYFFYLDGNLIQTRFYTNGVNGPTCNGSTRWNTNSWTLFCMVLDTNLLKTTVCGIQLSGKSEWITNTIAGPCASDFAGAFKLGLDDSSGRYLDGELDECAFWNRSLSTNEILNLYNYTTNGASYPWTGRN